MPDLNQHEWDSEEPRPQPRVDPERGRPRTAVDRVLRRLGMDYVSVCPCCCGAGILPITQRKGRAA